jgi:hypothetical protein
MSIAPRLLPLLAAALLAPLLSACVPPPGPEQQAKLAGACQTLNCYCAVEREAVWDPARARAVKFREDGTAYCPPGSYLTVATPRSVYYADPIPAGYYR